MPVPISRLLCVLMILAAGACDSAPGDRDGAAAAPASIDVAAGDAVVATVDGVPITASRVARLSRLTQRPPREVVERLIDFEVLAAEARRRGHGASREVRHAARQAMIQRYLEADFEARHRPEDMPEKMLQAAYEANRGRYVLPRRCKVFHILVEARKRGASPAKRKQARRLAEEIYRAARKATTPEEFQQVGESFQGRQGFKLIVEDVAPVHEKALLARRFIEASLALEQVGDISPPVDSQFGTHVIYLAEIREAKTVTFEEARAEVREKAHPSWLAYEFEVLSQELGLVASRRRGGSL